MLSYVTAPLTEDVTLAGRINADLMVSLESLDNTSGLLDADFVVKIIDVQPDNEVTTDSFNVKTGGLQRMVRAEVFRGKFRNSFEKPEGFVPGKISEVKFDLNDVAHLFRKGHRIMVQIQSSWFPIVDRNPQKFMRIPDAEEQDFQPVKITLHHKGSKMILLILQ